MDVNYVALAIPFFFAFIALEGFLAWRSRREVYELGDTVNNLSCGITQQLVVRFFEVLLLGVYAWVFNRFSLIDTSGVHPAVMAVLAYVGVDFAYYWWHRVSHRVNFMWAAHVVHHSSERYNLSVALRQGMLTPFTSLPFYIPLAFLGVSPLWFATANALNTLYQFWIHTELVGRVGFLERVLNTPSHHRVHHAVNARYIDKNYASTLMCWDQWFGTFEVERETPRYGITGIPAPQNPLMAQVHRYIELFLMARRAPTVSLGLKLFFHSSDGPAPWAQLPVKPEEPMTSVSKPMARYAIVQFALATSAAFVLMMWGKSWSIPVALGISGCVLLTVVACSRMAHGQPHATLFEGLRVVFCTGVAMVFITRAGAFWAAPWAGLWMVGSLGWLKLFLFRPAPVSVRASRV
jgi:alkylglycerol monooxygenase